MNILYCVIPCYNEEKVLDITIPKFVEKLEYLISSGQVDRTSSLLFVNDGSTDMTWEKILDANKKSKLVRAVSLSSNRGHQNALYAGLMEAKTKADIIVSLDCDGQDDINAIDEMINEINNGADIVYGVRKNREKDSFFKRTSAQMYYKFLAFFGVNVIYNHADYRMCRKKVIDALSNFEEVNLFLRGIFPLIGYKHSVIYYDRKIREEGQTHYSLSKMISLAFDGVSSFSIKPLTAIISIGICASILSLVIFIYTLAQHFLKHTIIGWSSIMCAICFFGGVQLLAIGIVGQYIGKIYMETKHRPKYIIDKKI